MLSSTGLGILGLLVIFVLILYALASGKKNNGLKFALFFLLSAKSAFALEISAPKEIFEGTAAIVRLKGEWHSFYVWKAKFLGQDLKFFIDGDDAITWIAAPIQSHKTFELLTIRSDLLSFDKKIKISSKKFPSGVFDFPLLSKDEIDQNNEDRKVLKDIFKEYSEGVKPQSFGWPLAGGCLVTSPFGKLRLNRNGQIIGRHWGVDCNVNDGEMIRAVAEGTVKLARKTLLGGNTVVIDHGFGVFSLYMHLASIYAPENGFVKKGGVVGNAGKTGRASGANLHLGIVVNGFDVDPIEFLRLGGAA